MTRVLPQFTLEHKEMLRAHVKHAGYGWYASSLLESQSIQPALWALWAVHEEVMRAPFASKEPLAVHMRLVWWRDSLLHKPFIACAHPLMTPLEPLMHAGLVSDVQWQALVMAPLALVDWQTPQDLVALEEAAVALFLPLLDIVATLQEKRISQEILRASCVQMLLISGMGWLRHGIVVFPHTLMNAHGMTAQQLVNGEVGLSEIRRLVDSMIIECRAAHATMPVVHRLASATIRFFKRHREAALLSVSDVDARALWGMILRHFYGFLINKRYSRT